MQPAGLQDSRTPGHSRTVHQTTAMPNGELQHRAAAGAGTQPTASHVVALFPQSCHPTRATAPGAWALGAGTQGPPACSTQNPSSCTRFNMLVGSFPGKTSLHEEHKEQAASHRRHRHPCRSQTRDAGQPGNRALLQHSPLPRAGKKISHPPREGRQTQENPDRRAGRRS